MRDMARILYNILCDVPMVEDIQYIGNAAYINLEDGDVLKISLNSSNENMCLIKSNFVLSKGTWEHLISVIWNSRNIFLRCGLARIISFPLP